MTVDVQAMLHEAETATEQGRYPQALEGFLWFHEHAAAEPALAGVRLSFALSSWSELADRYPPAAEAMRAMRAVAEDVVLDGTRLDRERARAFIDVAALNRQLAVDERTVAVYRRLTIEDSALAGLCAGAAFDAVVAGGDAALALLCLGDDPEQLVRSQAGALSAAVDSDAAPPVHLLLQLYVRAVTRAAAVLGLEGSEREPRRIHSLAVELAPPAMREQIRAAISAQPRN